MAPYENGRRFLTYSQEVDAWLHLDVEGSLRTHAIGLDVAVLGRTGV